MSCHPRLEERGYRPDVAWERICTTCQVPEVPPPDEAQDAWRPHADGRLRGRIRGKSRFLDLVLPFRLPPELVGRPSAILFRNITAQQGVGQQIIPRYLKSAIIGLVLT